MEWMGRETKILRFHCCNEYILLACKFIPKQPLCNLTKRGYEVNLPALPSQRILVYDGKGLLLEETALWKRGNSPCTNLLFGTWTEKPNSFILGPDFPLELN